MDLNMSANDDDLPASGDLEFSPSISAFFLKSGLGWLLIASTLLSLGMLAVISVPIAIFVVLRYATTHFRLTNDRLFMRMGIIFRSEEEVELYRVKDVRADFSIIQQWFGNGDLAISSSDGASFGNGKRSSVRVPNVQDARSIREEMRNRVEAIREKRGVREIDVG